MKDNTVKIIALIVVLLSLLTGAYLLLKHFTKDNSLEYEEYLKNYEVNEYIDTYVTDEDMARRYLNDYIHNMYFDIENAYSLLDEEYKNAKFGSLDSYKNYVNSLNYSSYQMDKYYKTSKDGYLIFGVYDKNGNLFIFKTKGVMQYTVYLDDYTVEI